MNAQNVPSCEPHPSSELPRRRGVPQVTRRIGTVARRAIAVRRPARQASSLGSLWWKYGGIPVTLLAAGLTELVVPAAPHTPHSNSLLLLAVVYTIATGGLFAGITSVAIATGYELFLVIAHLDDPRYAIGGMVGLILVVPATSLIVLVLRQRAELAARARDRVLREQAHAQAHAQALESANQRMDDFMSLASHELRSPLASIRLAIQLADRKLSRAAMPPTSRMSSATSHETDPEEAPITGARELLTTANAQVSRLDRLVRDLLDVSRIQADRLEIASEPRDLTALVREVVSDFALRAPERQIVPELPDEPVQVSMDADRIREVVENFLNNALRYAPPERPISVGLRCSAGEATVAVRDEGPGLSPEAQQRIWERFQRATPGAGSDAGQATGGGGLGLGLYLSREIVKRHQGRIGVESALGNGATFWFSLNRFPAMDCERTDQPMPPLGAQNTREGKDASPSRPSGSIRSMRSTRTSHSGAACCVPTSADASTARGEERERSPRDASARA
jgi:signal transduction histidine kinase